MSWAGCSPKRSGSGFRSAAWLVHGLAETGDFAAQLIDAGIQFAQGTVGGLGVPGSGMSGTASFAGGVTKTLGLLAEATAFLGESREGEVLGGFEKMAVAILRRGQGTAFRVAGTVTGLRGPVSFGTSAFVAAWRLTTRRGGGTALGTTRFLTAGRRGFATLGSRSLTGRFGTFRFLAPDFGTAFRGLGPGTILLGLEGKRGRQQRKNYRTEGDFQGHGHSGCFLPDWMKSIRKGQVR